MNVVSQTPQHAYKLGDQLCPVEFLFHFLFDQLSCDGYANHLLLMDVCLLGKLTTETLCKQGCGQQSEFSYNWDIPHYIHVAIPWSDCSITDCPKAKLQAVPHEYSGLGWGDHQENFSCEEFDPIKRTFLYSEAIDRATGSHCEKVLVVMVHPVSSVTQRFVSEGNRAKPELQIDLTPFLSNNEADSRSVSLLGKITANLAGYISQVNGRTTEGENPTTFGHFLSVTK